MREHLCQYFWSEGDKGFLNEVSGTFIDKTYRKNPKNRERYWMQTWKTIESYGLNTASVWSAHTLLRMFTVY